MNRFPRPLLAMLFWIFSQAVRCGAAEEITIADFEGKDYGAWKATGTAFSKGPARDEQLPQLEIENAQGHGVASSEIEGDQPIGTLTSPEFAIQRPYISFW